jgi:GNAT superfamily N-acetyltransferase
MEEESEQILQVDGQSVILRRTTADVIIDLRHRVLRAGLPRETSIFPGDEASQTLHVAAFVDDVPVSCATFRFNEKDGEPAWQLRGMATDEAWRGKNIGGALLRFAEKKLVRSSAVRLLWCNGWVGAIRFYERHGWTAVSPVFEVPTAGPHQVLVKRLPSDLMSLVVRNSPTGRGVYAIGKIALGTMLMRFTGPLLKYAQTTPQTLALQIGPDLYVGESGEMDDCVNHSCEPNAGLRINGTDVRLYALRDISDGEQITFDYSTTMDEDDFEFDCLCGSSICRGRIRDFKHLPAEIKRKYATLGIVPAHNKKYV